MAVPEDEPCYVCGARDKSHFNRCEIDDIPMKYQTCIHCTVVTFYMDADPASRKEIPIEDIPSDVRRKIGI